MLLFILNVTSSLHHNLSSAGRPNHGRPLEVLRRYVGLTVEGTALCHQPAFVGPIMIWTAKPFPLAPRGRIWTSNRPPRAIAGVKPPRRSTLLMMQPPYDFQLSAVQLHAKWQAVSQALRDLEQQRGLL